MSPTDRTASSTLMEPVQRCPFLGTLPGADQSQAEHQMEAVPMLGSCVPTQLHPRPCTPGSGHILTLQSLLDDQGRSSSSSLVVNVSFQQAGLGLGGVPVMPAWHPSLVLPTSGSVSYFYPQPPVFSLGLQQLTQHL